jgi:hypothetical protein
VPTRAQSGATEKFLFRRLPQILRGPLLLADGLPELVAGGELGRSWASGGDELGECPRE